jgi:glycosyltransferase involved in cell wall biosynthesis
LDAEFNFDFIYEDLNKLPLFTPFLTGKPHLIQIHHLWRNSIFREIFFPIAFGVWLFETLIPLFYRKSHFVTGGPSTVKELVRLGVDKSRVTLVYYGADGLPYDMYCPLRKKIFFMLSRVHRYKGILIALDAFKIFMQKNPDSGMQLRVA